MDSTIQVFENTEFGQVRAVEIDGEGWLVGKDVAEILGYKNPNEAIQEHVDEEDKRTSRFTINDVTYQKRDLIIINESGLYSLILRSNLPKAREFKRWVTSVVLPTLRKHGAYIDRNFNDQSALIDMLRAAATQLESKDIEIRVRDTKINELAATVAVRDQQIAELQPKASYYDIVLSCPDSIAISVIAKDYGMSAKALNKLIADYGVQYKQGDIWLVKARYQEQGYTRTKTALISYPDGTQHPKVHTYWTQKGRLFLYEFLKKQGVLPLCEGGDEAVA